MSLSNAKESIVLDEERLDAAYARARRAHLQIVGEDQSFEELDLGDDAEEPLAPEVLASLVRLREELKAKLFAPNPATRPNWSSLPPFN